MTGGAPRATRAVRYPPGMTTVSVQEASAKLEDLLRRVEQGEEIAIERDGAVVARLVPPGEAGAAPRRPGLWKGKFRTPDDFNEPLPRDILDAFEGKA